jgi:hypothetical protein
VRIPFAATMASAPAAVECDAPDARIAAANDRVLVGAPVSNSCSITVAVSASHEGWAAMARMVERRKRCECNVRMVAQNMLFRRQGVHESAQKIDRFVR